MIVTGPRFKHSYTGQLIRREEAIERAKAIAPIARRNAAKAEQLRRMPEENIQAILDSGLMPLMRPEKFGGFQADWMTHIDCVAEVASECGSTGWCMSFLIQHQVYLSMYPEEAQRFVYERQQDPTLVTSFAPTGKAKEVSGGFELSGDWHFGSAGDFCKWAMIGANVTAADGTIIPRMFLLRSDQFKVVDDWNAVGLKGTGSNKIVVEPTFVPSPFSYTQADALAGTTPGAALHNQILYRTPLSLHGGFAIMTPMHGIARGALKSFAEFTKDKPPRIGSENTADTATIQIRVGEARAAIDAAYLITEKMVATVFDGCSTSADRIRNRRDFLMIQRLLKAAVDDLFSMSGARGLNEGIALQRHWRDLNAICHHVVWSPLALQTAGREVLGLGPAPGDVFVI